MTKVKICGIRNLEDARHAIESGADELGFNFYVGSSRYIAPDAAGEIVGKLPNGTSATGVFVNMSIAGILEVSKIVGLTAVQLHGDEDREFVREIRKRPELKIIKAIRLGPSVEFIYDPFLDAHAILLDSYSPNERGGTGKTCDWTQAREISRLFPTVYLAGGLNAENVAEAIKMVEPYAVDVASGVESTPGRKDPVKVEAFIREVRRTVFS